MLIDAHVHLFEHLCGVSARGEARAIGDGCIRHANGDIQRIIPKRMGEKGFTAESYIENIMKPYGVSKAVLMQAGLYGFQNDYYAEQTEKHSDRFTGSCTVDPFAEKALDILERMIGQCHMHILKFEISVECGLMGYHPELKLNGREFLNILDLVSNKEASVVIDVGGPNQAASYQIKELRMIIQRYPGIRFVVPHFLGMNRPMTEAWKEDIRCLVADNVWFDISSLPWFMKEKYPFPESIKMVEYVSGIVSSAKLIWGSDAPVVLTRFEYNQLWNYLQHSPKLTSKDFDNIYSASAIECYRL